MLFLKDELITFPVSGFCFSEKKKLPKINTIKRK